jgi:hypothetical protein
MQLSFHSSFTSTALILKTFPWTFFPLSISPVKSWRATQHRYVWKSKNYFGNYDKLNWLSSSDFRIYIDKRQYLLGFNWFRFLKIFLRKDLKFIIPICI